MILSVQKATNTETAPNSFRKIPQANVLRVKGKIAASPAKASRLILDVQREIKLLTATTKSENMGRRERGLVRDHLQENSYTPIPGWVPRDRVDHRWKLVPIQ